MITVLVAEDEPPARRLLSRLLRRHADVSIVAECGTGAEAIQAIGRMHPDAVFLDVQMPDGDGFAVTASLRTRPPLVVFVTAFDEYAVRAFDVPAADYLLKPIDELRVDRAVERLRAEVHQRARLQLQHEVASALRSHERPARPAGASTRLAIKCDGVLTFMPHAAISHVTAEGCYLRIHTAARTYLVRDTLGSLERRLPASAFARVHRSAIVNVDAVASISPLTHGESRLQLTGGTTLKVSRTFRAALAPLIPD